MYKRQIFGGFISGKLLDSAIIGILAYVVLTIMRMPDTILLAVIIGVTLSLIHIYCPALIQRHGGIHSAPEIGGALSDPAGS